MNDVEEEIFDVVLEKGLSSNTLNLVRENLNEISSSFITDILVENANLHTDYLILLEFLPTIWDENKNSSTNLLFYISGLAHKLFYLARENPLGKDLSANSIKELDQIHTGFHAFKTKCIEDIIMTPEVDIESIDSFSDLIGAITDYPKLPVQLIEVFSIVSSLFYHYAINENQSLNNVDELSIFLSRCLIFWKLKTLNDKELIICLEKASEKYKKNINLIEFEKILALELQNYQFLQLGITHYLVKLISHVFYKLNS